jgi:hypothetical protein
MSQESPFQHGKPRWTAISVALFVIGLLILIPTGLCAALVGILAVAEGDASAIGFILMFAGLPALVGGVLIYAALKSRRRG